MDFDKVFNVNVESNDVLINPVNLRKELPLSEKAFETVVQGREAIQAVLTRADPRWIVVVGPCSIHDPKAALEYAKRLKKLADEVQETLLIVMRVYFEKPRTTVGWKGLINDPRMDDSFHIEEGLHIARKLLLDINELGLPCGTEALDPVSPQFMSDLMSWSAIGARTTESQTHREMASALSMPVGFKNGTDGGIEVALNALKSVQTPHHFLGINQEGRVSVVRAKGNPYGHMILRGGGGKHNYDSVSVAEAERKMEEKNLRKALVIDCSHANSNKDHRNQPLVMEDVVHQVVDGNKSIVGMMIESNLEEGNQKIPSDLSQLKHGVSVTDACVNWESTEKMLRGAHEKLKPVVAKGPVVS
jgi:3-deoxy-7-phosphoheptulonate synthase